MTNSNFYDKNLCHKIGGYAHFTQDDCREFPNHDFDIQLLQITSNVFHGAAAAWRIFLSEKKIRPYQKTLPQLNKRYKNIEKLKA